jgi:hypothetical protein
MSVISLISGEPFMIHAAPGRNRFTIDLICKLTFVNDTRNESDDDSIF